MRLKIRDKWLHLLEKNQAEGQQRFVVKVLFDIVCILNKIQIQMNINLRLVLVLTTIDQRLVLANQEVNEI